MDQPRWLTNPGDPDPGERRKAPPRRWPALPPEPIKDGFAVRRDWPDGTHTYFGLSRTFEQAQHRLARDHDYWRLGPLQPVAWSVVEIPRQQLDAHHGRPDCRALDCPVGVPAEVPPGGQKPASTQQEPPVPAAGRRWSLPALLRRLINRRLERFVEHLRAAWRPRAQVVSVGGLADPTSPMSVSTAAPAMVGQVTV
ncbi:hypothetical protein [Polymorphospora sp. NPDC050346]|uniref:hypothetical protein n=1 Tax=Polymorphospora sp. NPDC050346 TaxID=3155780 RepID=UPI0033F151E4